MPSPVRPADILASVASLTGALCDRLRQFLTLPATLYAWWNYTYLADGSFTDAFKADLVAATFPTGSIIFWPSQSIPNGFIIANGAEYDRTTYAGLFSVYGTIHGTPSDSTRFKVPDMRGRAAVGANNATFIFGQPIGDETITLTLAQSPAHVHLFSPEVSGDASPPSLTRLTAGNANQTYGDGSFETDSAGGGASHSNIQPSFVGHWIIRT